MKIKNLFCIASMLVASLSGVKAASTLTAWSFDNVATGANANPASSAGFGSAAALGFGGSSSPVVVTQSGSSTGGAGPKAWNVGNTGGVTVGWTTTAAIGSQGAKFAISTLGYYQIQVSFDVYAQTNSEAALLVQYSQDGLFWQNASITSAGTAGILATNTNPTNGIVVGSYLILTNKVNGAWNNGVTVDLSGVPGVANDPNFAIRIVNAATGKNCLDTTGAIYNSANNGAWTLDNVVVAGVSFDTVANWAFDNIVVSAPVNAPVPSIAVNAASAKCMGFGTLASPLNPIPPFPTGGFSTNSADVVAMKTSEPYSSTGVAGKNVWRLRGAPGNGWHSTQPIGSQGAEFDVSTVNFTNIIVTFDLYFTTQGEARMCVLYTTDGWATTNVANLACSSYPTLIQSNTPAGASESQGYTPNIVNGTFIDNTIGSLFYNYMSVDLTGVPGVANNPLFAFRVVNAATGIECVNFLHQPYNNNSGNGRIDNVVVSGQFNGQIAPVLTNDPTASVDRPFTNTFSENIGNVGWHTNISSIYVNGVPLPKAAYTVTASNIIYSPALSSSALTVAGLDNIVISATNYTSAKVVQFVATGVATKIAYTQPAGPSSSGGTLTVNPIFTVTDQYGNGTTNPYASMVVTATVSNSPATWTLGGATIQPIVNGSCTFTDLTATVIGSSAISNAVIHFAISGGPISATNSISIIIGAPHSQFIRGNLAAIQVDTTLGNSTFSVIEIKPSATGQTIPVNINPITATGTNALRMGGGGAGHLSLSDDGTFLVFGGFDDGSSATVDEQFNLNRAVGTLNYTNKFTKTGKYVSSSLGGSAIRAACSPDNVNFLIDDKGGLYVYDSGSGLSYNVYEQNNYCVRSFGGSAWSLTQKAVALVPSPAVFQFNNGAVGQLDYYNSGNDGPQNTTSPTPPTDGLVVDFYMMSTNGTQDPGSFGILYTVDQNGGTNGASGVINKFSRNPDDSWTAIGSWTNTDNANTLFATTNGNGGVYLYYANGSGAANSIVRVTDSSVMGSINIISTNTIYTAPAGATVMGLTFVPVSVANAAAPIPPPILIVQNGATVSSPFSITNTPDDPAWRAAITGITVNGSILASTAYSTTSAGKIVFAPSQSVLLQTPGSKAIVISATGYSTNSIVQTLTVGAASKLAFGVQPSTTTAGQAISPAVTVLVQDQYGNTVASDSSSVTISSSTTAFTGSTLTVAAASGVATFSAIKPTTAGGANTLTASDGSLTGKTSSLFTVNPDLVQFFTPHVINTPGDVTNVLGSTTFINHGLVGVGHISASALDSFGETFGSCSSMQITGWKTNGDGTYSGTLNVLPDRGYNSGNFYADYAARINQVDFKFTPYYGLANAGGTTDLEKLNAQTNQLTFGPISGVKFTYFDPNTGSNSYTTGLDPGTNYTTLFGKTMPYVGTYVGYQSPSSTINTIYPGINKLPLDSEALILKNDGSGYVGDEYGENIYYFNPSKQIVAAIVPPPAMQPHSPVGVLNYSSATTPLNGRRNNQGFEGVSLSPDGTRLFALQQSACVQDSDLAANNQNAKNTRLLIYDVSSNPTPNSPIAEYALQLPTYKGNGNGSAADKTCAQSEVVALDNHRFLVLPRDGNGLGNSSPNPNVYKSVLLVDTTVGTPVNLAGDAARNAEGGKITTASGVLDTAITPLSWVEAVNMLNTNQLAKFNVQFDTGSGQVSKLTMGEKWEGLSLVSANDPANPDDYFLFVGNDNDFLTSAGQMKGPDGTIVGYNGFSGYPANRIPAALDSANNENDTRILAFRVTIQKTLPQIDHIVVIYQENWSFDALYGNFPGANGIANASTISTNQLDRLSGNPIATLGANGYDPVSSALPTNNPPVPLNGTQDIRFLSDPNNLNSPTLVNTLLPYDVSAYLQPGDLTGDIVHRYWQEQFQIDHGNMDKFMTWSDNPGLVMSHFDATQLPEGMLAQQYTMCDNFFHSAFGGSFLNHQFFIAAQAPVYPNAAAIIPNSVAALDTNGVLQLNINGAGNGSDNGRLFRDGSITPIGGVCFANTNLMFDKNYVVNTTFSVNLAASGSPTATSLLPSLNDSNPGDGTRPYIPTIGDRMDAAGVSWKWYSGGWDRALNVSPSNPAHYGTTVPDSSVSLFQWHHQAFAFYDNYAPWTNGVRNARSVAHLQDENNFFSDVSNSTLPSVVFIKPLGADNEHPGYASLLQGQLHVSNIVAAVKSNPALWAHTVIIVTYDEHGGRWDHVTPPARDIWGPGARVPGIIISPFAKTNYVDHTQYETLSILKTIENRFGLAPLTPADAAANSLAPAFTATPSATLAAPLLTAATSSGQIGLSWPAGYTGYVVQMKTNLTDLDWTTIYSGTNSAFSITPNPNQPSAFYRLIQP